MNTGDKDVITIWGVEDTNSLLGTQEHRTRERENTEHENTEGRIYRKLKIYSKLC